MREKKHVNLKTEYLGVIMLAELFDLIAKSENFTDLEFDKELESLFTPQEIQRQNDDFDKYYAASLSKGEQVHPGKVAMYKNFLLFLIEVQEEVEREWRSQPFEDFKHRINAAIKLYNKSIRVAMESIPLIQVGAPQSLLILWRALYNDFIVARFIMNSKEKVAGDFNDFSQNQYQKLTSHQKTQNTTGDSPTEKQIEMNDYAWSGLDKKQWNFSKLVELVQETKYYLHYKVASMYHHSSSFSVNHSLFRSGGLTNINSFGLLPESLRYPFNLYISVLSDFTCEVVLPFLPKEKCELLSRFILVYQDKLAIKAPGQKEMC